MRKLLLVEALWLLCTMPAGADEWSAQIARAEAFLPESTRALVTGVYGEDRIELRWNAAESAAEWRGADGRLRRIELPAGKVSVVEAAELPEAPAAPPGRVVSSDGRYSVYAREHNLHVETRSDGSRQLTFDGELWRSFDGRYAYSNPLAVPRPSPVPPHVRFLGAGPWLVAERWDFRKVGSVWLADSLREPRPAIIEQRMAFPGDRHIPLPELWLINVATGERRLVENPGWDYIGNMDVGGGGIFPGPGGHYLYYVRMTRGYDVVELCRIELPRGEVEVIWREERESYFTVRIPELAFVGEGRQLIWKSDRDGRVHYYLLDSQSKRLVRQLTHGDFTVGRVLHVDPAARMLYFAAYGDPGGGSPYFAHGYRVSLDGGPVERLDREEAMHDYTPSPSGRYFVDTYSTVQEAPRSVLRDRSGEIVATLASADTTDLQRAGWTPPERFRLPAADGETPLYGVLWKPFDFDPERRYPVIATVYPGPTREKVPRRFDPAHPNTALAQLGFIVVSTGTRGASSARGVAYQSYARTTGNVRDYPLADLRHVLESLGRARPWMNLERVGIMGHSGGGFMAVAAMLQDPGFYDAGVASAGNHDNNIYEMNSSEFYWGSPDSGPAGGTRGYATNMEPVERLSGALLLIHGETDADVSLAHTLRLADALIRADKPFDLLVLPGQGHGYQNADPQVAGYVRQRAWRHFLENLLPRE